MKIREIKGNQRKEKSDGKGDGGISEEMRKRGNRQMKEGRSKRDRKRVCKIKRK